MLRQLLRRSMLMRLLLLLLLLLLRWRLLREPLRCLLLSSCFFGARRPRQRRLQQALPLQTLTTPEGFSSSNISLPSFTLLIGLSFP